jgi:hypothetical protein
MAMAAIPAGADSLVRNLSLKAWGLKEKSNKPFWPAIVLTDYVFWVTTPWDTKLVPCSVASG